MPRAKSPSEIRSDALRLASAKLAAGCEGCSESYLSLARRHGATEEEIANVRSAKPETSPRVTLSRRVFLQNTAVAVSSAAVAGRLFTPWGATRASASADGSGVLWLVVAQGQVARAVGLDASASIVGTIDGLGSTPFRSHDGTLLYIVTNVPAGTTSTTRVDVYDAGSGGHSKSLDTNPVSIGPLARDRGFDTTITDLTPDGRFLVLLHQTRKVIVPDAVTYRKALPPIDTDPTGSIPPPTLMTERTRSETEIINTLEVVDTVSYRVSDPIQLSTPAETASRQSVYSVDLSGARPKVVDRATDGEGGRIIPPSGLPVQATGVITPDNTKYYRWSSYGTLQKLDLSRLTIVQEAQLPACDCSTGCSIVGLFARDGSAFYVAQTAVGVVTRINTADGTVGDTVTLPQSSRFVVAGAGAAALSNDESLLYLGDGQVDGGLYVVHTPDLRVLARYMPGTHLTDIWVSPGGRSVYALDTSNTVHILDAYGKPAAATTVPGGSPAALVH